MMATAVAPITTPIKARRRNGSGINARTGEAGGSSRGVKSTAETINSPTASPSIRYSGQWRLSASLTAFRMPGRSRRVGAVRLRAVARAHPADVVRRVTGGSGCQRPQPGRRQKTRLHGVDDALGAISFEERQRQPADREDLVGAKRGVDRAVSMVHVDHVVQVPSVRVPEAFQEGPATAL